MINFELRAEEYFITPETRLRYNFQVHKISLFKKNILVAVQKIKVWKTNFNTVFTRPDDLVYPEPSAVRIKSMF